MRKWDRKCKIKACTPFEMLWSMADNIEKENELLPNHRRRVGEGET